MRGETRYSLIDHRATPPGGGVFRCQDRTDTNRRQLLPCARGPAAVGLAMGAAGIRVRTAHTGRHNRRNAPSRFHTNPGARRQMNARLIRTNAVHGVSDLFAAGPSGAGYRLFHALRRQDQGSATGCAMLARTSSPTGVRRMADRVVQRKVLSRWDAHRRNGRGTRWDRSAA